MGPNDYELIFELTSPTFPTLGKDVYAEKLEYQDYVTMPFIVPSADNEAFRYNANGDILYSADGTIAYYCNYGHEIAEGTRIINGGFMENGQMPTNFYISATVDSIGDRAFANVDIHLFTGYPQEDMTCYPPNPPKLGKDVFVNSCLYTYNIPVYVPSKSYDIYKTTEVWKDFKLRRLVDDGIENVTTGKQSSSDYYDLQGRKVKKPVKGLYINDGKKVVVK
jgi:hypothetical protein